jgi:hypothetical protein
MNNKKIAESEQTTVSKPNRVRRRRRDLETKGPLYVAGVEKLQENFQLRWVEDGNERRPDRVHQMTVEDDYEPVSPDELGLTDWDGNPLKEKMVWRNSAGKRMYLLKKPKEFYEEDLRAKVKRNDEKIKSTADEQSDKVQGLRETSHLRLSNI